MRARCLQRIRNIGFVRRVGLARLSVACASSGCAARSAGSVHLPCSIQLVYSGCSACSDRSARSVRAVCLVCSARSAGFVCVRRARRVWRDWLAYDVRRVRPVGRILGARRARSVVLALVRVLVLLLVLAARWKSR